MRFLAAVVVIAVALAFQTAVLPAIHLLGVRPDLLLVLLMCWAFIRGPDEGRVVVVVTAMLYGMLTADPAGFSLLALAPIVPLALLRESDVAGNRFVLALALVAAATLAHETIYSLLIAATEGSANIPGTALHVYAPAIIVNVLLGAVVYLVVLGFSRDVRATR